MRTLSLIAILALPALTALAAGCYPKAGTAPGALPDAQAESAKAKFPDATPASLEEGRQLFVGKCNGCHNYPDLTAVDEGEWPSIVNRMGDKVGFNDDQKKKVREFVLTARAGGGTAAAPAGGAPATGAPPADSAAPAAPPGSAAPATSPATPPAQ